MHDFPALYFILNAQKCPAVGAVIPGHALHVLKTVLYAQGRLEQADSLPALG